MVDWNCRLSYGYVCAVKQCPVQDLPSSSKPQNGVTALWCCPRGPGPWQSRDDVSVLLWTNISDVDGLVLFLITMGTQIF